MNLSQIVKEARVRLDDAGVDVNGNLADPIFTTSKLVSWANEGHIEACRRTRYLIGNITINVKLGTSSYNVPCRVISIRRAKISTSYEPISIKSYREFDDSFSDWESETGEVRSILTDFETNKIRLYPIPDSDSTLTLNCVFEPDELTEETDIPSRYGFGLVDYVMYRAYQQADIDTYNPKMAERFLAAFDREFGTKSSALDEIYNSRHRPFDNFDGHY